MLGRVWRVEGSVVSLGKFARHGKTKSKSQAEYSSSQYQGLGINSAYYDEYGYCYKHQGYF